MMREDFIKAHPIQDELEARGVKLIGGGKSRVARCPFHEDKSPSFSVNLEQEVWCCHAGCGGGSVIDLIARYENKTPVEVLKSAGGDSAPFRRFSPPPKPQASQQEASGKGVAVCSYVYRDTIGEPVYKVVRYLPKTFRQAHPTADGKWVWGMEGVERVLYHLPEIAKAEEVWVVEGEKDADNLGRLGIVATCNVGGAGKWMDSYSESLAGKAVVICGDNDKPGQDHVKLVFESISGHAKSVRIVKVPAPHKDASDFIAAAGDAEAKERLLDLRQMAPEHVGGVRLPIQSIADLEASYSKMATAMRENAFSLGRWLPRFGQMRSLIPGELVLIMGDTGTGKTAVLQSIALAASPLPTLFFEMELPGELLFERFLAAKHNVSCQFIEDGYAAGDNFGCDVLRMQFPHIYVVTESKVTITDFERIIDRSELKIGKRPKVVMLDYVQLLSGTGKRYERTSDAAEQLKVVAKSTGTIVFVSSQVQRQTADGIGLHSAKDSGSLENSAGLVLGITRVQEDATKMRIEVLKSTKGGAGVVIDCIYNAERMRITQA